MKTGVTYSSKEFRQSGNATICVINAYVNLNNTIRNFTVLQNNSSIYKLLQKYSVYNGILNITAIGETHCRKDDLFDANIGQKIADTKAQSSVFLQVSKFFEDLSLKVQEAFLDDIAQCSDNAFESYNNCYWHAKDLGNTVDYLYELEENK